MKRQLLILLLLLNFCFCFSQTEIYVDATSGVDSNNNGNSSLNPIKTINKARQIIEYSSPTNVIVKLKRGEIWFESLSINSSQVGHLNSILFTDYGDKALTTPIISGVSKITDMISSDYWESTTINGESVWEINLDSNLGRMFTNYNPHNDNGVEEMIKAYDRNNLWKYNFSAIDGTTSLDVQDKWFWDKSAGKLFVANGSPLIDPKTQSPPIYKSTNNDETNFYHINVYDLNNITFENIEFHGGIHQFRILECLNIEIRNCVIGKYSTNGILIKDSSFISIHDNIFDTVYKMPFGLTETDAPIVNVGDNIKGVDSRGNGDGIEIENAGNNCDIFNNTFNNWCHSAIFLSAPSPHNLGVHDNEIYNNQITAPDLSYSRGIAVSGIQNGVYDNEIYNNLIKNTRVQNQIAGNNNYFHHNIIDGITQSDLRARGVANGIEIANYDVNYVAEYNLLDHNTIINCEDAGISVANYGKSQANPPRLFNPVQNNKFRYNIIYNCGVGSNSDKPHVGLEIKDKEHGDGVVKNNSYVKNLIYNDDKVSNVISYREFDNPNNHLMNIGTFHTSILNNQEGIAIGNINNDPEFYSLNDYRLKPSSPCYNAGVAENVLSTYYPLIYNNDYYGNSFPLEGRTDIGHEEVKRWTELISSQCGDENNPAILQPDPIGDYIIECNEILGAVEYNFKLNKTPGNSSTINSYTSININSMNLSDRWWFEEGETYEVKVSASLDGYSFFNVGDDCYIETILTSERSNQTTYNTKNLTQNISIYPNPTSSNINIKTSSDYKVLSVEVFSSTGKTLVLNSKSISYIDLSNYSQGLYFIKISTNKGDFFKRIIKN